MSRWGTFKGVGARPSTTLARPDLPKCVLGMFATVNSIERDVCWWYAFPVNCTAEMSCYLFPSKWNVCLTNVQIMGGTNFQCGVRMLAEPKYERTIRNVQSITVQNSAFHDQGGESSCGDLPWIMKTVSTRVQVAPFSRNRAPKLGVSARLIQQEVPRREP